MTATLHELPLTRTAAGQAQPASAEAPRASANHPLVQELRRAAWNSLETALVRLFTEAPEYLQKLADEADEATRSACYACMRLLPMQEASLSRALELEFDRNMNPLASRSGLELGRMALLPTEDLEENVALTRMAGQAKARYAWMLNDIEDRIGALARSAFLPLSSQAFSPLALCGMFRAALDGQDLEFAQRKLMLQLFEHSVLADLDSIYGGIGAVLDQMRVTAPAQKPPAPVDPAMLRALQDMDGFSANGAFSDGLLAAEVLAILRGKAAPGAEALRQRTSLIGQMFAEILADPCLPPSYLTLLERLRFATLKTALADGSFFTNPAHPVRWLVQDAVQMAVNARLSGEAALHYTGDRLSRLPEEFNISAAFVQPALQSLELLSEVQAAEFMDTVRAESAARWSDLLTKSRRIVAHELETQTLESTLDAAKLRLLRSALAPLLGAQLLRHGLNSARWREASELVSAALAETGPSPQAGAAERRQALRERLRSALRETGLPPERLESLMQNLEQIWGRAAPATAPATSPAAVPAPPRSPPVLTPAPANDPPAAPKADAETARLCATLLRPETWYRVFDARAGESKWLKLVSYYPERQRAAFCGFSAENQLSVDVPVLLDDFKSGRSEPISPSDEMQHALRRLRGG